MLLLTVTDGSAMRSFRQVLGHFRPGAVHPKVSPCCKTGTYYTNTHLHYFLELEDFDGTADISCLSHYEPTLRGFTATTYWTIRPKASPRHNTNMYYTNTRPRYYLKLEDFGGAADFSFSEWTTDISLFTLRAYATGSSNDGPEGGAGGGAAGG